MKGKGVIAGTVLFDAISLRIKMSSVFCLARSSHVLYKYHGDMSVTVSKDALFARTHMSSSVVDECKYGQHKYDIKTIEEYSSRECFYQDS